MSPSSTTTSKRPERPRFRRWGALVAVLVVPLLLVGTLGWATVGTDTRLPAVRAAVVNHDKPVTVQGQLAPMGRQLAAELVEGPDNGSSYTWVLSDDEDAAEGLASGRYVARVVIPEDFSAAATSYGGDALGAEQATLDITTSSITGVADAEIARQLAAAAATSLGNTLTEGYLEQIYLGFSTSAEGMRELADGTRQLSEGAGELSGGAAAAYDGSTQLADGLGQLQDNGPALTDGAAQLDSGARQLADGLGQLQAGTATLPDQTAQLADGARQVADGAAQLSAGLDQLSDGAGQLSGGADTYATGVQQYTDGVTAAADGAAQLSAGIDQMTQGLDAALPSPEETARIQAVLDQLRPVLEEVAAALQDMQGTADRLATGTGAVVTGLDRAVTELEAARSGAAPCPADIGALGEDACTTWQEGVRAGAGQALDLLTTTDSTTGQSILTAARSADEGARTFQQLVAANGGTLPGLDPTQVDQILAALNDLPGTIEQLQSGVQQLDDGAAQLSAGLAELSDNGPALLDGARQLSTGAAQLADGATASADGAGRLADGAGQVADGTDQLAAGMVPLSDGIGQASDGSGQLADGVGGFTSGLGRYVDGVGQTSGGANQLSIGLEQLSGGADQLADGTDQLATEVGNSVDAIPTYSEDERKNLATVVATPIATDNLTAGPTPRIAAGSLIGTIALWLGALATYVLLRPLPQQLLYSSRSTPGLVHRTLWPGVAVVAAQAVGVSAALWPMLDLPVGQNLGVLAVLLLGAVVFALTNHALAAWFGTVGRIIALLMAAVTVAGALTSAVPALFDTLRPLMVPAQVLDAVRAVATGGSVAGPLLGILAWGLLGAAASALAIARKRGLTATQYVRAYS